MARFVSQETVARLSGILPSQTTRSQVAKFKLDHHKMIYKEKRRMSMPGELYELDWTRIYIWTLSLIIKQVVKSLKRNTQRQYGT